MGCFPIKGLFPLGGRRVVTPPLPYDAEVEYIESTGTQYIDTGIYPSNTTGFSVRVSRIESINSNNCPIGVTQISGGVSSRFGCILQDVIKGMFYSVIDTSVSTVNGSLYDISINKNNDRAFKVNGTTISSAVPSLTAIQSTATVFAHNIKNNEGVVKASYNLKGRIYSLDITDGSTLVRSFVPCRVGPVGYLFDLANPTGGPLGNGLYGSATATPLVAGPDKNGG